MAELSKAEQNKKAFFDEVINFAWVRSEEIQEVKAPSGKVFRVKLKQPTVAVRGEILARAKMLSDKPEERNTAMLYAHAVLACAFDPETDTPLIDAERLGRIINTPAGQWVDQLGDAALKLMNVKALEVAKKSDAVEAPQG